MMRRGGVFLEIGFRNLFRQKRRTLVTLVVITFGIGCLLLTAGHSVYITWGLRELTIHSETGHLQVFHPDCFRKEEETVLQYGLENHERIRNALMRLRDVSLVLARIELMGLVSNGDKSVACMGTGVEPREEKTLRTLFGNPGSMYDSLIVHEKDADIAILGKGLAKSLNVGTGEWLTLLSTTADGALNAVDVKVVGMFDGGTAEVDRRAIVIPLGTAQALLNSRKVNKLLVALNDTKKTDRLCTEISGLAEKNGYPVAVRKWHEQAAYYKQVRQFYHQVTGFISLVLFVIVFFSISNTVMMSIVERTPEIGTMLSMGTSRWQTLKMYFFEGMMLGVLGGVLSAAFAFGCSFLINGCHIVLPPPPGFIEGYPLSIRNESGFYARIFAATVAVSAVSSILPAFRVTRMKIVDALGHV